MFATIKYQFRYNRGQIQQLRGDKRDVGQFIKQYKKRKPF